MPKFAAQVDLQGIPIKNLAYENLASDPAGAQTEGRVYFNTATDRVRIYINGAWQDFADANALHTGTTFGGDVSGAYNNLQLGADVVGAAEIAAGAVGTTELADGSVTSAKIADGTIATADIANDAVTYAKMQNVSATDRLLGRDTAAAGDVEELTVGGGLEFTGTGGIQRSAISGDITIAAGSGTAAITAGAIVTGDLNAATTLDAIATARPATAAITANGQKITNLGTPTADTDAATKAYVDAARSGLDVKQSVRVGKDHGLGMSYVSTGGTSGRGQFTAAPNVVDGVTVAVGDRILVGAGIASGAELGIYTVTTVGTGSNGVWDRATDFDANAEVTSGAFVFVSEGSTYADKGFVLTTNDPITIGGASGTSLTFTQFSGAGQISAGQALLKTGDTLDVMVDNATIEVNADALRVKDAGITSAKLADGSVSLSGTKVTGTLPIANGGTGGTTQYAARLGIDANKAGKYMGTTPALTAGAWTYVNHAKNETDMPMVSFYDATTKEQIFFDVMYGDPDNIQVRSDIAMTANSYIVSLIWARS